MSGRPVLWEMQPAVHQALLPDRQSKQSVVPPAQAALAQLLQILILQGLLLPQDLAHDGMGLGRVGQAVALRCVPGTAGEHHPGEHLLQDLAVHLRFQQILIRPLPQGVPRHFKVRKGRQQDHLGPGGLLPDGVKQLQAVHHGHFDIRQNQLRLFPAVELQPFPAIVGHTHQRTGGVGGNAEFQPLTNQLLIVNDHYSHFCSPFSRGSRRAGSRSVMVVPISGTL